MDQDALNTLFNKNYLQLPIKFDRLANWVGGDVNYKIAREIYHYVGDTLQLNMDLPISRLWFEYFMQTPFCNPNSFENLFSNFSKIVHHCSELLKAQKTFFNKIIKSTANRRRVFIVCQKDQDSLFDFFGNRNDDLLIDAMGDDASELILHIAQNYRSETVFIVYISMQIYPEIYNAFISLGLKENEDFFNGIDAVSTRRLLYDANRAAREM